jgi:hypothetical protein
MVQLSSPGSPWLATAGCWRSRRTQLLQRRLVEVRGLDHIPQIVQAGFAHLVLHALLLPWSTDQVQERKLDPCRCMVATVRKTPCKVWAVNTVCLFQSGVNEVGWRPHRGGLSLAPADRSPRQIAPPEPQPPLHNPSSVNPGKSSGRGPSPQVNRRSSGRIGTSLMLASRRRIRPVSENSQFSLP